MDDAKIHAVAIVVERGHVMKVLSCTGKVRQRNETQKRLRRQTNLGCRNHVASEGLSGLWIKDLHWQSAVESGGKLRGGEISIALSRRGNGREDIIRIRDTRQREAAEEESLGAAVVNLGDVQRSTNKSAEAALVVIGFRGGLSS